VNFLKRMNSMRQGWCWLEAGVGEQKGAATC